jgi:capsid protein
MGRGLPWLLASLKPAHDLHEITRSKTKQIKDANSISGFIESERGGKEILPGLTDDVGPEGGDDAADAAEKDPVVVELRPGTFVSLNPGEKITLLKSEYDASDYKELIMIMLHAVSSPVGLPVELWFSGLGDVNYSGFKGLGVQWNSRRRHVIAFKQEKCLDKLQRWQSERETLLGNLPAGYDHDMIEWAWRQTSVLDPEKEARSNKIRLDSGENSLADIWEEKGLYAEEVFAARRELWIKLQEAAGLLKEGEGNDAVIVPVEFLYRGRLPGEQVQGAAQTTQQGSDPSPDNSTDPVTK